MSILVPLSENIQRVANGSLIEDGAEDKSVDPAVDDDYTLIK